MLVVSGDKGDRLHSHMHTTFFKTQERGVTEKTKQSSILGGNSEPYADVGRIATGVTLRPR